MLGERAKSVDHARQAEALAESLGDERRLGQALGVLAARAMQWGDADRGLELGERALAIAIRLNDVSLQTSVNFSLGRNALIIGDYRQSAEILGRVAEMLQGDRRGEWLAGFSLGSVGSRTLLAWCLTELGEFAEAMAQGEERLSGSPARRIIPEASSTPTGLWDLFPSAGAPSPTPFRRSSAPSSCAGWPRCGISLT